MNQPDHTVECARLVEWTESFTPGRFLLLICLLLFAAYPEVILGTHSFFDRDFGLFTYPAAHFTRTQLWQGRVPLWNPLSDCGVPFLAQWNTTVCYPLSWLYVLAPLPWALNYFCLGHLVLAGFGMYLLAHHWTNNRLAASVAGLGYCLNGLTINCLMWTSNVAALAWLPFTILYVSRAWRAGGTSLLPAVLAAALQMLAGAPEIILLTWILLASLWLLEVRRENTPFRVSAGRLALIVILVCGLCAVQLLPFFELVRHSDRNSGAGNGAWSMPLAGLANFLVPLFHCSPTILGTFIQANQQWTTSYYVGVAVVGLALVAARQTRTLRVHWLAAVALFSILLALGDPGLLYRLVKQVVPLFGLARYPIKFVVPAIFALPLLAAFGINQALARDPEARSKAWRWLFWIAGVLLGLIVLIVAVSRFAPSPEESWRVTLTNGVERGLFLLLIVGALFFLSRATNPTRQRWLGFGLLILFGFDAITHTARQNATVPNRAYGPLQFDVTSLPKQGLSRAMVSPRMQAILSRSAVPDPLVYYVGNRKSLFENCNLIEGIPKVNGFFSLHLREQAAINAILYQPTNYPAGLIDFLSVTQLSSSDEYWQWLPRNSALPLVTGGQKAIFAEESETLEALASPAFDSKKIVYLPKAAEGTISATNSAAIQVGQTTFSENRVSIAVDAKDRGIVVISQSFYPAWKAIVDGNPAQILRANHAFQALEVPAGQHSIEILYRDAWFLWGAAITGISLLACLVLQVWFRRHVPVAAPRPP